MATVITGELVETEEQRKLFATIKARSRITILIPNGRGRAGQEWAEKTVTTVIPSPGVWACNGGGRFGTPHVCTPSNLVAVGKKRVTPKVKED